MVDFKEKDYKDEENDLTFRIGEADVKHGMRMRENGSKKLSLDKQDEFIRSSV
jgi:hypothetical protein